MVERPSPWSGWRRYRVPGAPDRSRRQGLGEGEAGPANVRFGSRTALPRSCAPPTMPGAGRLGAQPADRRLPGAGRRQRPHRRRRRSACRIRSPDPCHLGRACRLRGCACRRDGGIVIVGTGSIGWANLAGQSHRVGGWGFPVSDEGSGAWLGSEAVRRVLWASDGRMRWTDLLRRSSSSSAATRMPSCAGRARRGRATTPPRAPYLEHAANGDRVATHLMQAAAMHIDARQRLIELGVPRLSLMGGLAAHIAPWLRRRHGRHLVAPVGDALSGALRLAGWKPSACAHDGGELAMKPACGAWRTKAR